MANPMDPLTESHHHLLFVSSQEDLVMHDLKNDITKR